MMTGSYRLPNLQSVVFSTAMWRSVFITFFMAIAVSVCTAETVRVITAEEWSRPRRGADLVALPALADTVNDFLRRPDQLIQIRYPGGEEGVLWAEELRGWLVALGLESANLRLVPGAARDDVIELTLVTALR